MGPAVMADARRVARALLVVITLAVAAAGCASSTGPDPLGGAPVEGPGAGESAAAPATGADAPDPRCAAVRSALLRPAVLPDDAPGLAPADLAAALAKTRPLTSGATRVDLDAVIAFTDRYLVHPALAPEPVVRDLHARMDRLAIWAADTCSSAERVWSCSARSTYPRVADNVGFIEEFEPISAQDAVAEWYGERVGQPAELHRDENRVVYAWLDGRGMAVRRVEVLRTGAYWAVTTVTTCGSTATDPEFPQDMGTSVDVEGPDLDDYLKLVPAIVRPPAGVPPPPCGYDPYNATDAYTSLANYVATSGHAEAGCFNWLGFAGWACVRAPQTQDRIACFDLDPVFPPPPSTTTTSSTSTTVPGASTTTAPRPPVTPSPAAAGPR